MNFFFLPKVLCLTSRAPANIPHPKDTIDLQDHDAPSAKDHRSHRGPGAHQTETLREVDREAHLEQQHSPRLSWTDPNDDPAVQQQRKETEDLVTGVQARMAQEDALAVAQNGGVSSSDEGEGDGDELDDDLMDRISSSPSIEDGAYRLQRGAEHPVVMESARVWPRRVDSLSEHLRASAAVLQESPSSVGSSTFLVSPVHLPLGTHHLSPDDDDDDYGYDYDETGHDAKQRSGATDEVVDIHASLRG